MCLILRRKKWSLAASTAGGKGRGRGKGGGKKGNLGAVVKPNAVNKSRKRQIDDLVLSDNEEEKPEVKDEAPAGLLTEI